MKKRGFLAYYRVQRTRVWLTRAWKQLAIKFLHGSKGPVYTIKSATSLHVTKKACGLKRCKWVTIKLSLSASHKNKTLSNALVYLLLSNPSPGLFFSRLLWRSPRRTPKLSVSWSSHGCTGGDSNTLLIKKKRVSWFRWHDISAVCNCTSLELVVSHNIIKGFMF